MRALAFKLRFIYIWGMALAIRSLPVLEGAAADDFVKKADKTVKTRRRLDLSKEVEWVRRILKKADI